jgi:hypothetical protein
MEALAWTMLAVSVLTLGAAALGAMPRAVAGGAPNADPDQQGSRLSSV